jgi:deoxyadenosine/deoxycytidine kinase
MQSRANVSFTKIFNSFIPGNTQVTERSSYSSQLIFSKMLFDKGLMSNVEFSLLHDLITTSQSKIPDYIIYLKTDPRVCYQRVLDRGDPPQSFDYLTSLGHYHDHVLSTNPNVVIIDTSTLSKQDVLSEVVKNIRNINLINSK